MDISNSEPSYPVALRNGSFLNFDKDQDGNEYIKQENINIDAIDGELRGMIYEGMEGMDDVVRELITPQVVCIEKVTVVANYARIRLGRVAVRLREVLGKNFETYCKEHIYGSICKRSTLWKCKTYSSIPGVAKQI